MTKSEDIRAPHLREADFLGAFAVIESAAGILMVQNRRHIGGQDVLTWDLPGGQVESGETLHAAVRRELTEETTIEVKATPRFLFVQEGLRTTAGRTDYAWRSFFFGIETYLGEPQASEEVLGVRWVPREAMDEVLGAPYHDSFQSWLASGGHFFLSVWAE